MGKDKFETITLRHITNRAAELLATMKPEHGQVIGFTISVNTIDGTSQAMGGCHNGDSLFTLAESWLEEANKLGGEPGKFTIQAANQEDKEEEFFQNLLDGMKKPAKRSK